MRRIFFFAGLVAAISLLCSGPAFAYGPNAPSVTTNTSSVTPGGTLVVTGTGFEPNSLITLVLHSDPVTLGTVTANANGSFTDEVTVPSDTPPGDHTIIASDTYGDTASTEIVVTAAVTGANSTTSSGGSGLAFTGADIAALTSVGAVALALGGMLVLATRKRRAVF